MDVASVTCKTVRSNAQLQEQLTGRQVKGKGHIALEYIVFVAQLGGVIALESGERVRRLQVEDGKESFLGQV